MKKTEKIDKNGTVVGWTVVGWKRTEKMGPWLDGVGSLRLAGDVGAGAFRLAGDVGADFDVGDPKSLREDEQDEEDTEDEEHEEEEAVVVVVVAVGVEL